MGLQETKLDKNIFEEIMIANVPSLMKDLLSPSFRMLDKTKWDQHLHTYTIHKPLKANHQKMLQEQK